MSSQDFAYQLGVLYSVGTDWSISKLRECTDIPDEMRDKMHEIQTRMEKHGIHVLVQGMDTYHHKFLGISSPPFVMYALGNLDCLNLPLLGVVGPRMMSSYGQEVCDLLLRHAQEYRLGTISGLAKGVDQQVHQRSLDLGIPTVAVLGGGLEYYLRSTARSFIEQIISAGGLILSEFRIAFEPTSRSFPQRNRIIAGLCDCLVVPEAAKDSGSLITVHDALKLHKTVYGFPHAIGVPSSEGIVELMEQSKVRVMMHPHSCLERHFTYSQQQQTGPEVWSGCSDEELKIIQGLGLHGTVSLESLSIHLMIPMNQLLTVCSMLEMKGIIVSPQPGCISLSHLQKAF